MKVHKIVIPGDLPDYNKAINNAKAPGDKFGARYRKHKEEADQKVFWMAKKHLKGVKIFDRCSFVCHWYKANRNLDPDNIAHAVKYILDGLQQAGVLSNDGWRQCGGGFLHNFAVDKENPRVEVFIIEGLDLTIDIESLSN